MTTVKAIVKQDYLADSTHVRSLFILGHVPVPYSGDIAPDGHTPGNGNHQGAWPADIYYGNFYTNWTDKKVRDSTGQDHEIGMASAMANSIRTRLVRPTRRRNSKSVESIFMTCPASRFRIPRC